MGTVARQAPLAMEFSKQQHWSRSPFPAPADLSDRWLKAVSSTPLFTTNLRALQCSCLENLRDGEAWWAAVYGVAQTRTRLKRLSSSSSTIRKGTQRGLNCKFSKAGTMTLSVHHLILSRVQCLAHNRSLVMNKT